MGRRRAAALALALAALTASNAAGARSEGRDTGLPVPRFVSLRADTVNMRAGPGLRYPIDWVFKRRGLPVVVLREFNAWRKVRTAEGTAGWIHAAMLSGKRTVRVVGPTMRALLADPGATAATVAMVEPGAIGDLDDCDGNYCRIDLGAHSGWIARAHIFGVRRQATGK